MAMLIFSRVLPVYSQHNQSLFPEELEEKKKKTNLRAKNCTILSNCRNDKIAPLKDFDEKQEPTTSVQMKVELRKMGKTNLLMMMIRSIRMMMVMMMMMIRKSFLEHN